MYLRTGFHSTCHIPVYESMQYGHTYLRMKLYYMDRHTHTYMLSMNTKHIIRESLFLHEVEKTCLLIILSFNTDRIKRFHLEQTESCENVHGTPHCPHADEMALRRTDVWLAETTTKLPQAASARCGRHCSTAAGRLQACLLACWAGARGPRTRSGNATRPAPPGCSSGCTWTGPAAASWTAAAVCRRPRAASWTERAARCPPSGCPAATGCSLWWWPAAAAASWTAGTPCWSRVWSRRSSRPVGRPSSWSWCLTFVGCCAARTFSARRTGWAAECTCDRAL